MIFNATLETSELTVESSQPTNETQHRGQHDFLRLILGQAKNAEFLPSYSEKKRQEMDFNATNTMAKMQSSLKQLATSLQSNQALQASALVGRQVLIQTELFHLSHQSELKFFIEVTPPLTEIVILIYNYQDQLIRTITAEVNSGLIAFSWDGTNAQAERMKPAKYKIQVIGFQHEEKIPLKTMTLANINSVSLGKNRSNLRLNVAGIGSLPLNQVYQIIV